MQRIAHPVITANYPENAKGGIMVCGINFGVSKNEELAIANGEHVAKEIPSFFSDQNVRKSDRFNSKIVDWLSSWGLPLTRTKGQETAFDKCFFQTNWVDSQTENADLEGRNEILINNAAGILSLIEDRRPSIILFFGRGLIEALSNTQSVDSLDGKSVRDVAESILGLRSGNPKRHEAMRADGTKAKNHLLLQKFGETQIICFPHPTGSYGVSDDDMRILKPPIYVWDRFQEKINLNLKFTYPTDDYPEHIHTSNENDVLTGSDDPLFDEVKSFFADSQPSVSDIQLKWRLGYSRALAIKEALFS